MSEHRPTRSLGWSAVQSAGGAAVIAALAWYAAFQLPFRFPPRQRLWSASYAFGFNNSVAICALLLLVGAGCWLYGRRSTFRCPISFDKPIESGRSLWLAFALIGAFYGLATLAMYKYQVTSAPWLMWEVRHLNYRTLLMEIYHLRPYTDFSAEYGPILTYLPLWLYRMLHPLGATHEQAYFVAHFLLNLSGLFCLAYVLSKQKIFSTFRVVIFIALAITGFAPYMGTNGVLVRYLLPFASMVIACDTLRLFDSVSGIRRVMIISAIVSVLLIANLVISSEVGVAFAIAWLSYCVISFRRDSYLPGGTLVAAMVVALLCWILLPPAYYRTLINFSRGANNLPLIPAPHLLFYLVTIFVLLPNVFAGAWKESGNSGALCAALGILCVVMVPGALGRCDPPHVLLYGMGATMLLMVVLAARWPRLLLVYLAGYILVFLVWIQLVHLHAFYHAPVGFLFSRHGIHKVIHNLRHSAGTEYPTIDALSTLDSYPRIGLPFASFEDPAIERYIVERGHLQPEYFVSVVGVYTPADLQRKLRDVARMEYVLIPADFLTPARDDVCQQFRTGIEQWFLRGVYASCRGDVLNPVGEINSFIRGHYMLVEHVGSSVLMHRIR